MATYRLEVDATEFRAVLKRLKRFARGIRDKSVRLSYKEGNLALAAPGVTVTVPADGRWPRTVKVTAQLLILLIKAPPPGDDPFVLSFDGKRLSVAGCSTGASIVYDSRPRVDVLPTRRFFSLLRMGAKWSREDLEREGLLEQVLKAEAKRDKLLGKAEDLLLRLGIDRKDMDELLKAKLRSQTTKHVKRPVADRNDLLGVAAGILAPLNIDRADLVDLYSAKREPHTPEGPQNREA